MLPISSTLQLAGAHLRRFFVPATSRLRLASSLLFLSAGSLFADPIAQLTLQWQDNSVNERGFKIERKLGADPDIDASFAEVATVDRNVTSYVDTTVTNGTEYSYRVRAYNDTSESNGPPYEYSNTATATAKQAQSITFPSFGSPKTYANGGTFTMSATSSSALPVSYTSSNPSVATIAGSTVTIVGAGTTIITASQAGDLTFASADDVTQTLVVNPAAQTITFGALGAKTFGNSDFALTATATSGLAVTFSSSNLSVATVSGTTVHLVGAGTATITASQAGNSNYAAAPDVPQSLVVGKAAQTITFSSLASKTFGDGPFSLSANVGSGQTITFVSSDTSVATISGNEVTIVGAGTTTITAKQAGNSNYTAATDVPQSLVVDKAPQTITFSSLGSKTFGDAPFSLSASASSGLAVTFVSSNTTVATIIGNEVTLVGAGTTTITASQTGNSNYLAAPPVDQNLTVAGTAPTITNPANQTVATSGNVSFSVTATGTPAPTFQWEVSTDGGDHWAPLTDGGNYSGVTTATLVISNVPAELHSYQYRCVASNGVLPDATSTAATLTIDDDAPLFTTQPDDQTVNAGEDASFTIEVTGADPIVFQWQVSTDEGASWTDVPDAPPYSGTTTDTLTITNASYSLNGYLYRCLATNDIASANSLTAALTVNGIAPQLVTQPSSQSVTAGDNTSFTISATGTPAPTYQWQVSTDSGAHWTNLTNTAPYSGVTTVTLSITSASTSLNGHQYRAVATNGVSPAAESNAATLTVSNPPPPDDGPPPISITSASSAIGIVGQPFTFAIRTSLPASSFSATNLPTGLTIDSSTGVISGTFTQAGSYTITLRANGTNGTRGSRFLFVTVYVRPTITTQPQRPSIPVGGSITLTANGNGFPASTYQWRKNGVTIVGASSTSLTLSNVQVSDAGSYSVVLKNSSGSLESQATTVGIESTEKVQGDAIVVLQDVVHPNGNVYDQVLLQGKTAAITADKNKITRLSFIDLNDDIIQVELAGAGTLSLSLADESGPALPTKYNQDVQYVKGHASIVITGANETSNVTVFSVGRATAVDQTLFRDDVIYDSVADLASISIESVNGKFGGVRAGNASFFAVSGLTGLNAPGVEFVGPIYIGDISASDGATPVIRLGGSTDVRITGGSLLQANDQPVEVSGITQLQFTDGTNSQGDIVPAQQNQAKLEQDGVDVTDQIVVNPAP